MSLTPDELEDFKKALHSLCQSFGVFIRHEGIRRESPNTNVYFYEVELSAKVSSSMQPRLSVNIIESKDN